jgi:hypothetical protein
MADLVWLEELLSFPMLEIDLDNHSALINTPWWAGARSIGRACG